MKKPRLQQWAAATGTGKTACTQVRSDSNDCVFHAARLPGLHCWTQPLDMQSCLVHWLTGASKTNANESTGRFSCKVQRWHHASFRSETEAPEVPAAHTWIALYAHFSIAKNALEAVTGDASEEKDAAASVPATIEKKTATQKVLLLRQPKEKKRVAAPVCNPLCNQWSA